MKKNKGFLMIKLLSVIMAVCAFAFPMVACGGDTTGKPTGEPMTANYYCIENGTEYTVSFEGTSFSLDIAGDKKTGTFNLSGNTVVIYPDGGEEITASFEGGKLKLTYKGKEYELFEDKNFVVTFVLNGGTGVESATVRNGQKVQAPQTVPEKEGYVFEGWYSDADLTKPYKFDVNETGNVTLYAKFIENTSEYTFTATFKNGAEQVGTAETVNGKLYNLPVVAQEGKKLLGWWVSVDGTADKLSYKYEGQILNDDCTLYAVWDTDGLAVSVSPTRISWNSQGAGAQYLVTVVGPEGEEILPPETKNYVNYGIVEPGEYVVTVSYKGTTATAYYKHKCLAPVKKFEVEGNTLKFKGVPDATSYYLSVECENPEHNHIASIKLGENTAYDFSECGMTEKGLSFVVEAEANGYVTSYSEAYKLVRTLGRVGSFATDETVNELTWGAVENAEKYIVKITTAAGTETIETTETKADLGKYSGAVTVSVVAVAKCYNNSEEGSFAFTRNTIATPVNFNFNKDTFTWDAVENATGYVVKIGAVEFRVGAEKQSFVLTAADYATTGNADTACVKAVGGTVDGVMYSDSLYTEELNFGEGALAATLAYQNGKVSWNGVFGATAYSVKVNGEIVSEKQTATQYALKLEAADTKIAVCYYRGDKASDWKEIDVKAYVVTYETGKEENEYEYLTAGDNFGLPVITKVGYTFKNWLLNGEAIGESTKFAGGQDVTLVAQWKANTYKITLDKQREDATVEKAQYTVTYNETYTLNPAVCRDSLYAFAGWYTEPNGKGIQYAYYTGESLDKYVRSSNCTLYAYYVPIFKFEETNNGKEYAVLAGTGISFLSEVTVPDTYNGKKVTGVVSFDGCSNLTKLRLPDTVTNVEVGADGGYTTGSAFNGCRNLINIEVYHVQGVKDKDIRYKSEDGVLYKRIQDTDTYELAYYPKYREGAYVIPSFVVELPVKSLYSRTYLTELTIPASVTRIGNEAISSCSALTKITFESSETATDVQFGEKVFKSNSKLQQITLPSGLKNFDAVLFDGCSAVEAVYIQNNDKYVSKDGVLCQKNEVTGVVDTIVYFPKGRAGEYTIPQGITTIAEAAFKSSRYITKLTIPGYVTYVGKDAFNGCYGILELVFEGKADDLDMTIDEAAFYGVNKIETLTLPENLKVLKVNAFGGTTKLQVLNLNVARTVVDYAEYSFHTTNATEPVGYITTINIGKDTPKVDNFGNVFGSSRLKEVNVDENNQSYFAQDGVLFSKTLGENAEIEIVYFPGGIEGEYVIPGTIEGKGTIKTIGGNVFYNAAISSVVIPSTVTSIGDSAFRACKKLTAVKFENAAEALAEDGSNALELGARAFMNCSVLKDVTLPERLVFIGDRAFMYCSVLETVTIPKNVTTLEETLDTDYPATGKVVRNRAFDYCNMLAEINVAAENQNYFSVEGVLYKKNFGVDNNYTGSTLMLCPKGKAGLIDVDPSCEKIAIKAFYANDGITEITFSKGINGTSLFIGEAAFNACQKLEKLSLPNGLQRIEAKTFYQCDSLKEIFIPKTVTFIGVNAFKSCDNLQKVTIEDGYLYEETEEEDGTVTREIVNYLTIEDGKYTYGNYGNETVNGAIVECPALTEIVVPGRAKTIGKYAFASNASLKKVVLSEGVEEIGEGAFRNSSDNKGSIEELVFPENNTIKTIGSYAFYRGLALSTITVPEGVTKIDNYAFAYNDKLESISLPSTLATIGTSNFSGANKLSTVIFRTDENGNSALTAIPGSLFSGCAGLTSIVIPKSVTGIGSSAFSSTKNLETVTFAEGSQLTKIDINAFYSSGIKSIKFPKSIVEIANGAFSGASRLATVEFEEESNITKIGNTAFSATAITEFRFPKSTAENGITLGTAVFQNCKKLTTVYISESVSSLEGAFSKCSSITSLVISENSKHFKTSVDNPRLITNVDGTAIRYVLGTLDVPEVVQKDKDGNTITDENGNPVTVKEFVIPKGIIEISPNAFEGQNNIEKLVISSDVQSIGNRAFANCWGLKDVVFEEGCIPTMGIGAFSGCYYLENVKMPTYLRANAKGYYVINEQLFDGCRSLKSITLPLNTTHIGQDSGNTGFSYTFRNCTSLEEVILPDTLKIMAAQIFENCGIKSITIPASVEKVGGSKVFIDCRQLETVVFENAANLTLLGGYTFANCYSLKSVDISAITKVTTAPTYLFQNCYSLTEVKLPDCFTSIGANSFFGCSSLEKITLPAKATIINANAFKGCTSLKTVDMGSAKLAAIKANAFEGCTSLEQISLPSTVNEILAYAFYGSGLKSIVIPNAVTVLGTRKTSASTTGKAYTFAECKNLTTVTFGTGCKKIGGWVFENCTSLTSVNMKQLTQIGQNAFAGCTSLQSADLSGITSYSSLYVGAFQNCTSLTDVKFNANLTCLQARLFEGCTALTEITIPAKVYTIGNYVANSTSLKAATYDKEYATYGYTFAGCTNLQKVNFAGNALIFLGYKVFSGCEKLTDINIPQTNFMYLCSFAFEDTGITEFEIGSKLKYVGTTPFLGCSMTSITSNNANIVIDGNGVVSSADGSVIFYYPAELPVDIDFTTVTANTALYGNTTETEVTLPEGITAITAKMFYGFKGLKKIVIPEGVTEIGNYAFAECTGLTEIVLPSTLTKIGEYAFQNCGLTAITLPDSLTTISKGAFQGSALATVTIPASVTAIAQDAFRGSALETVVVNCDILAVEGYNATLGITTYNANSKFSSGLFADCVKLTKATFNGGFNVISNYMFQNCSALTEFDFSNIKRIDSNSFENTGLKEITLPADLYYINGSAFKGCDVERLTMPGYTYNSIGSSVFEDCDKLVYADVRGLTKVGSSMFKNCTALETVLLGDALEYIYAGSFDYCTSLKSLYVPITARFDYKAYTGWGADQTLYIIGDGRDYAAKELKGDWLYDTEVTLVLVPEEEVEEE